MGIFLFPVLAFFLWEIPSIIAMSAHQLICALTRQSLIDQFLGIWTYRLLGMFTVWPIGMLTAGTALGDDGIAAATARVLLPAEAIVVLFLLVFAKTSNKGK